MGPTDNVPRLLECGTALALAGRSHLAVRAYLHLFWGEGSEKPGFGRCGLGELSDVLKSSSRAVRAALDELASAGLIVWSEGERLAYRPGFARRFNPENYITHTNWYNTTCRLRDGLIRAQVLEDIGPRRSPPNPRGAAGSGVGSAPPLSASSASSASSVTPPPSVAAPQATLPGVDAGKVKADKPDPNEAADALIAAYNAACPSMPRALLADGNRKAATAALNRAPLEVWAERFARAERSDLLAGRKTDWRASFVWLLKPANALKLDEGQYDTRPDGSKRKSNNAPSEPIGHFDTVFPWDEVGS